MVRQRQRLQKMLDAMLDSAQRNLVVSCQKELAS
jgi:hypothetical protein